jgi:hypothetical protein
MSDAGERGAELVAIVAVHFARFRAEPSPHLPEAR